jgi:DNA-binding CsgD family transcriptional regulator
MKWGTVKHLDEEITRLRVVEQMTIPQIAECLGISNSSVHRRISEMQLPQLVQKQRSVRALSKKDLADLYASLTSWEIAELFGCAVSTVNRALESKGIPRKQTKGWLNLRIRLNMTTSHRFFAHKLVEAGLDLRWDWIDYPVTVGDNHLFFIDIAIPDVKVGFEIDGNSHRDENGDLVINEDRDELLASCGWKIYHLDHEKAYLNGEKTAHEMVDLLNSFGSMTTKTRAPATLQQVK